MTTKNKSPIILSLFAASFYLLPGGVFADVISGNESPDITEPSNTYDQGGLNVLKMNVETVIGTGSCSPGAYEGCTLNDVLNDTDGSDDHKPEIKVHMTAGTDFPDDGLVSNATLRLRGLTSRSNAQKSFRIKLDSKDDLWREERRIQLIKAMFDFTRVRNKLSYDLFAEIPHLPSMRTQFVELDIKDQGANKPYGLYTHVEHFGKEYLKRRNWDKDSRVYKAEAFEFFEDSALAIDPATGKPVNKDAFEEILEIKRGKDHTSFANMISDVNNLSLDFNTQIMGKYFNRDNYLTWLAVNILVNNYDTNFHNYYLFNPKANDHFYLVPWDYDLAYTQNLQDPAFGTVDQLPRWWFSHASWWNVLLHQRFLSEPGNLALLKSAVSEVKSKYLSSSKIQAKVDSYKSLILPILTANPDWKYLFVPSNNGSLPPAQEALDELDQAFDDLSTSVEDNYARFMARADDPMVFRLKAPNFLANNDIKFNWTVSESLTGQTIVYDLEIATTKEFEAGTIIRSALDLSSISHTLNWTHPKGTYYFRVRAKDNANPDNWQEANNNGLVYENGMDIYGVRKFVVTTDGPPPTGLISNPVSSIQIDGSASEWSGLTLFASDPDDIPSGSTNVIDLKNIGIAHDPQKVYVLYKNYGPINPSQNSGSYLAWGWSMFIDTDSNKSTGFKFSDAIGAEYLASGNRIYKYTGSGSNWSWLRIHSSESKYTGSTEEFGFSRSLLGNPQTMRIAFQGTNEAFGGNTVDYYPDGAQDSQASVQDYGYSFGGGGTPTNHPPVTQDQDLTVVENKTTNIGLTATDSDGDTLTLEIKTQPSHGNLTLTASPLFVEYKPDLNYTGADSFSYVVNDGTVDSNKSTVSIDVIETPPTGGVVSNPVVNGAITVNGSKAEWSNLDSFAVDPDDVGTDPNNIINWKSASIAHSADTVYFLYENRGNVDPDNTTGSTLKWGWQAFLDTDNSSSTGFDYSSTLGVDYMLEGRHIFKYTGSGDDWSWVEVGTATVKYKNAIAELQFPRSMLGSHSTIRVRFYGNNRAFGGSVRDKYPDVGGFKYSFGSGRFSKTAPISRGQKGVVTSPLAHKPTVNTQTPSTPSKGGSFSWILLLGSLLLIRKRVYKKH